VATNQYGRLLVMTAVSFAAMFVLMYAMVDVIGNAYPNLNQFYMAGLMAASMVAIEIAVMSSMYRNKKLNVGIGAAAVVALILCFVFIRLQTGIADRQFLKSMIPHHAGAILMCERASISDTDIRRLCQDIIVGQQAEIAQMKAKLHELR